MIQRTLLRQSQAICLRPRIASTLPASRTHFPPIRIASSPLRTAPRLYSTTPESTTTSTSPHNPPAESKDQDQDPLRKDLEAKTREIIDLKDKYLRSVADFRNLQDRTKRDIDTARSFAISRFAADLIESIDNLDRALATVPSSPSPSPTPSTTTAPNDPTSANPNQDLENLHEGLKMTERILMQTLKKHGLERFDPSEKGEMFNPNLHEATFQTRVEGKEDGSVFTTVQKGFLLNGRVVRAAKVGVVKNT